MKTKLYEPAFRFFPAGEIRPAGWLRRQLEIQAEGLSGNLDKFWPDISDSRWIGGSREGWERVPYWLDGFLPLAWLLDREDLKQRGKRYVDAILAGQREDGWLCPCSDGERADYDMWALFLILKVLVLYEDLTQDPRIEPAVYRALKNLDRHIDANTLNRWAQTRWFECWIPLLWLYERRPEDWMLGLARKLKAQGLDYEAVFEDFLYREPEEKGRWSQMSHGVNLAMMLKISALTSRLSGSREEFRKTDRMLELLDRCHGTAVGIFTADECLAGQSPVRGTELCAVTEMMYSMEHLAAASGEGKYADRLELLAFNALPATLSPDMWSHQYDQQVNQISCVVMDSPPFGTNSGESNLFGLEPNYGCCTANFNQGWPKFALSTMLRGQGGVYLASYAPNKVCTQIDGMPVEVEVSGSYPFRLEADVTVRAPEPVRFPLLLRIPGWAAAASVTTEGESLAAEAGACLPLRRLWKGETTFHVAFAAAPEWMGRPHGMAALRRGPLVYALPLGEEWQQIHQEIPGREFPHCDYQVLPTTPWAYGFAGTEAAVKERPMGTFPFSPEGAPVGLEVLCAPVAWDSADGCAAPLPRSREAVGPAEKKLFLPYGCTSLRMTELPLCQGVSLR
ncbi:MAG TPA: glycoside hydrolase family 127 protein [Candidatus Caccousia avistercoris]|nr:glycoside hydrolase family 127 protein [Candidatus Caccousia avistercoris]